MKDADLLMLAACELACGYPGLDMENIAGDVHQVARFVTKHSLGDPVTERLVVYGACRFLAADKDLPPAQAVEKVLRLREALQKV